MQHLDNITEVLKKKRLDANDMIFIEQQMNLHEHLDKLTTKGMINFINIRKGLNTTSFFVKCFEFVDGQWEFITYGYFTVEAKQIKMVSDNSNQTIFSSTRNAFWYSKHTDAKNVCINIGERIFLLKMIDPLVAEKISDKNDGYARRNFMKAIKC